MKICGFKEKCFEKGELWGHFSGILCKNLSEKKNNKTVESFCLKFNEFVKTYSSELEYKKIKGLK